MRKFGLILLLVLPLLLVLGWCGLWFVASSQASAQIDAMIASERELGRDWTCPGRHVGGFPLAFSVTCTKPTYAGQAGRQRVRGEVAQITASLRLDHPRQITVDVQPPFKFRTSDGTTDVTANWRTLAVDLTNLPDIRTAVLRGTGIALDGLFFGGTRSGGKAEALSSQFTMSQDQPDPTLDFDIALKTVAVPVLDTLLDSTDPVDVALGGRLDRADIKGARTPEQAMEQWRVAGGRADIDHSTVSRAGASLAATGTMRLDEQHRLKGRLDAEFTGLEPILARYGISGNLAAVGSLVSTLFGGGGQHRQAPPRPGAIDLPIVFNNGRLGVGPITTDIRLPPLY